MFAVFRHPDVAVAGILPAEAAELQRYRGWFRVSDWSEQPQFNLADFGADLPDLDDEDEDTPKPKTARKAAAKKTEEQ